MAKHLLALDIPETLNTKGIRISDSSIYSSDLPKECPKLEITLPGFNLPSVITTLPIGFLTTLSACDLGIQVFNCEVQFNSLPDGVYIIRYSLSPNDQLYVEYNHLRITCALNTINDILCCLDISNCEPEAEVKKQLRELWDLWMLLKGAKSQVEYCHHPKKGGNMYDYVTNRLNKIACKCGCSKTC